MRATFFEQQTAEKIASNKEHLMSNVSRSRTRSSPASCARQPGPIALIATRHSPRHPVAQLVVRNLPQELVKALKQRAARNNRSAEQEHREILQAALNGPSRRPLIDVLGSI